jgi:hypothetical protein
LLLGGVAAQVAVGRPVGADVDLGTVAVHGALGGLDTLGLSQVVGQALIRPVGAVQAAAGRAGDDPGADVVGQLGGDVAGLARGLAWPQTVEAAFQVGVEPALHTAAVEAQVKGDVLARAALVGQQDDLEAVAKLAVVGGTEHGLQTFDLRRG